MIWNERIRNLTSRFIVLAGLPLLAACSGGEEGQAAPGPVATVVESGASHPTVAVSPETGRGYIAWVGTENDVHNVLLATIEPGSLEVSEPRQVNDIPGDAAPHEQAPPQVVLGEGETVYVIWQNNTIHEGRRFPTSDLRMAVSRDGGKSFAPAITVNDDVGEVASSHTFHNVAISSDGKLAVSWIDNRRQDRIRAENPGVPDSELPDAGGPDIRVAWSIDGGQSFTSSQLVDTGSCPCCRTGLTVGPDGTTYVAWRKRFEGEIRDIVVATAPPGSTEFGDPVRVHADDWEFPGCPHAGPSLVTDPDGRLHVGWYTGKDERQGLWYTVSDNRGASFAMPVPFVTGDWVPPSQVSLSLMGGEVVAAWEDRTGDQGMIVMGTPGAGEEGVAVSGRIEGRGPAVAAAHGNALVAWLDGESIRASWMRDSELALR